MKYSPGKRIAAVLGMMLLLCTLCCGGVSEEETAENAQLQMAEGSADEESAQDKDTEDQDTEEEEQKPSDTDKDEDGKPEDTPEPEEKQDDPEESEKKDEDPDPSQEDSGDGKAEPEPTPSQEEDQDGQEDEKSGEAWTKLSDGKILSGDLKDIVAHYAENGGKGKIYLLKTGPFKLKNVPDDLLKKIELKPDPDEFDDKDKDWEVSLSRQSDGTLLVQVTKEESDPDDDPEEEEEKESEDPRVTLTAGKKGSWTNEAPAFTITWPKGTDASSQMQVYNGSQLLTKLGPGKSVYKPKLSDGKYSIRFKLTGKKNKVLWESEKFEILLDTTAPAKPELELNEDNVLSITWSDSGSGIAKWSLDKGKTWKTVTSGTKSGTLQSVTDGTKIPAGQIVVKDHAGNTASNDAYTVTYSDPDEDEEDGDTSDDTNYGDASSGEMHSSGNAMHPEYYYNAVELRFSGTPVSELWAGQTKLDLVLDGGEGTFTVEDGLWTAEGRPSLMLRSGAAEEGEWSFSGNTCRLLANSGVEYLLLCSGGRMAVVPTTDFVGGVAYDRLKSEGVASRCFEFTLSMKDGRLNFAVKVNGEEYPLEDTTASLMYRKGVYITTSVVGGGWKAVNGEV